MKKPVYIVGAGFSGAVIARELAEAGVPSVILEERAHIGGNCHTERCPDTGVMLHRYGPHIFHTDLKEVWEYVNRFSTMMPYTLRIKTTHRDRVYQLPINLHTINQFFSTAMRPKEAEAYIREKADHTITSPQSFEEQALSMIGKELYEAFFKGYTEKQWGMSPTDIPASVLKRLPVRFNYDDNYFFHPYQGIPRDGYTALIENILDHSLITVHLNTPFQHDKKDWSHLFYSGPIDRYFNYELGRLEYRTLTFKHEVHTGDYQGTALMNFPDAGISYTRINEHKHFAPWETHETTLITREYSSACGEQDIPYYPVRLVKGESLIQRYQERAAKEKGVTFIGRLGTYQYLDMDKTIAKALETSREYLK